MADPLEELRARLQRIEQNKRNGMGCGASSHAFTMACENFVRSLLDPASPWKVVPREPVAWRWRYYESTGKRRNWVVRQSPVAAHEPSHGMCGVEVEPLYAASTPKNQEGE
jgi:hypothetical protein